MVAYESSQAQRPLCERVQDRRREELGKFLRARRAQLAPEDFGLPGGSRRRTPGLRREELALLAGVGVTWYTWLEQGREINASVQVLDALARTGLCYPHLRLSGLAGPHLRLPGLIGNHDALPLVRCLDLRLTTPTDIP